MNNPSIILGVPLMDRDHALLEDMLDGVAGTSDAELADLLLKVEAETRAHFEREEALMREWGVPVLSCHMVQHELLLGHFKAAHVAVAESDNDGLRSFLSDSLPALLVRHMNTADRVTAGLLANLTVAEA